MFKISKAIRYQRNISYCFSTTQGYVDLEVPLSKKTQVTHDTCIFNFQLPTPESTLGLKPGQHIGINAQVEGPTGKLELIQKKYTPISIPDQKGSFDLLIKIYRKIGDKAPGAMTSYLDSLNLHDKIKISGPHGKTIYNGNGNFMLQKKPINVTDVGFIVGGTGITPAYQVMQYIYNNKNDSIRAHLLFANKSEDDILLYHEVKKFASDSRFKINFIVDKKKSNSWDGHEGYVTKELISRLFPAPNDKILMTFCGPPGMKKLITSHLEELKYDEDLIAFY